MRLTPSLSLLSCCALLASAASAQTPAATAVQVPCSAPAPPGSLVPKPLGDNVWAQSPPGLTVIEVESVPAAWPWVEEAALAGYTGESYYRWDGLSYLSSPPSYPALEYRFEVQAAGEYLIRLRNRHDHPQSNLENDCWMRIDDGPWERAWNNTGPASVGVWNWKVQLESTGQEPRYQLAPGVHSIKIKGRSFGFKIDRLHLHLVGLPGALSTWHPESPKGVTRPILGKWMRARIDDPTDFAGLTPGATFVAWLTELPDPNAPCGTPTPGLGAFGAPGELFLRPVAPVLLDSIKVWNGPGQPVDVSFKLPAQPGLVGTVAATQAVFVDTAPGAPSPIVLSEGLRLTAGDA